MNMLLTNSAQCAIRGRFECKCCDGAYRSSRGIKARRRSTKRIERQTLRKMLDNPDNY